MGQLSSMKDSQYEVLYVDIYTFYMDGYTEQTSALIHIPISPNLSTVNNSAIPVMTMRCALVNDKSSSGLAWNTRSQYENPSYCMLSLAGDVRK